MPNLSADDLRQRRETMRGFAPKLDAVYSGLAYLSSDEEDTKMIELLVKDVEQFLEGLNTEARPDSKSLSDMTRVLGSMGARMRLDSLVHELREVFLGSWSFELPLTVEEWAAMSPEALAGAVRIVPDQGVREEEIEDVRITRWTCEVGKLGLHPGVQLEVLNLTREIAVRVVEEARKHRPDVPPKFWNQAREYNPQRILSLRPGRLVLRGLPDECCATLEFANLEEALALPEKLREAGPLVWPSHPTLPVPWRCMRWQDDARHGLFEESLGTSLGDALIQLAEGKRDLNQFMANMAQKNDILETMKGILPPEMYAAAVEKFEAQAQEPETPASLEDAVGIVFEGEDSEEDETICESYLFALDSPDLPVVSKDPLAAGGSALALKAREIWFQRFREVLEPALPAPRRAIRFLLSKGRPRSPWRTFAAKYRADAPVETRPVCAECGEPCNVAVNLNFTHHDLPFKLPGATMLLHTCSEHNGDAEWWHFRWLAREASLELEAVLAQAGECLAGPAVRVVEFDKDRVDSEITERPGAKSEAYNDSWEKTYRLFAGDGTKAGGGVFWIQGDPGLTDSKGNPLQYIGQVGCNEFLDICDSGIVYILYSPETGETTLTTQYY